MIGRRDYAERRAARLARLEARADRLRAESASRLGAADRIASVIPLGQPILIGHHSERRHRRDIARIDANMRKGVEASKQADAIERRLEAAEENAAISSDDPEAVVKLKEKLAKLTEAQERMKAVNACIRKHIKKGAGVAAAALVERFAMSEAAAKTLCEPDFCGRIGFADYQTKNNSAEIRRVTQRIAHLQRAAALPDVSEEIGDVKLETADNRVQLHFPGKPPEAIRTELKRCGFRWAPSEGAWQRMRSAWAITEARRIAALAATS